MNNTDYFLEHIKDNVDIEGQSFKVYTSVGYRRGGGHAVKLEFTGLDLQSYAEVSSLWHLGKALDFKSELLTKHNIDVSHIIAEKFHGNNFGEITLQCLSDKPFSLIMEPDEISQNK